MLLGMHVYVIRRRFLVFKKYPTECIGKIFQKPKDPPRADRLSCAYSMYTCIYYNNDGFAATILCITLRLYYFQMNRGIVGVRDCAIFRKFVTFSWIVWEKFTTESREPVRNGHFDVGYQ